LERVDGDFASLSFAALRVSDPTTCECSAKYAELARETVLVNHGKAEVKQMKTLLKLLMCGLFSLSISLLARAGTLDAFERSADADNTHPAAGTPTRHGDANDGTSFGACRNDEHGEDDGFGACLAEGAVMALAYGGVNSLALVYPPQDSDFQRRENGDAVIPFMAFDTSYQRVAGDVSAMDYRGELGAAFIGFQARTTLYDENSSGDDLKITQLHGLYRMSFGKQVEVDLGFGSLTIRGEQKETGFSMTTPVLIHPNDHLGIEWRPVWSTIKENRITDNDLSVTTGWRYVSFRIGYRWVTSDTVSLNGPQAGLSLRW